MLAIGIGAFAMLCLFFAFIVYDRGEAAFDAKIKAVDLTNKYAIRAPEGNFRRSLLLALANLDATAQPRDFYESIMGGNQRIQAQTLAALRELLPRTPWFAGPYQAVGLDPAGSRIALLSRDNMTVLTIPAGDACGRSADESTTRPTQGNFYASSCCWFPEWHRSGCLCGRLSPLLGPAWGGAGMSYMAASASEHNLERVDAGRVRRGPSSAVHIGTSARRHQAVDVAAGPPSARCLPECGSRRGTIATPIAAFAAVTGLRYARPAAAF